MTKQDITPELPDNSLDPLLPSRRLPRLSSFYKRAVYRPASFEPAVSKLPPRKPVGPRHRSSILSIAVTALIVPGLFATVALPAYASVPGAPTHEQQASAQFTKLIDSQAQSVVVSDAAKLTVKRDSFGATSQAQLDRARAAGRYSGPSIAGFLKNPPYPHFSLARVVQVAKRYTGVPYVFGGSSPAGFDCSGFTAYVYAQVGVALPHSSAAQGRMGRRISRADARPGDLVVISDLSHVGIYMGNGYYIDAPYPGKSVGVHKIWTNAYYIVRLGI